MFDRVVEREPFSLRRGLLGVTSLVLHAVALLGLALFSLLHVPEIAPPAVTVTFLSAPPPPPPPPPPPAGASKPRPKVEKQPEQPKIEKPLVQPDEIKELQPTEPEPETQEPEGGPGEEGGEPGGVPGGVAGGVVGGVVGGTGPAPVAPKMVASFVLAAQQLEHPAPRLPEWFKQQHPHETVKGTYKVCLGADGRVTDVTPMTSIPGVDELVVAQIKQGWSYKPQPLPICTASVIVFQIN